MTNRLLYQEWQNALKAEIKALEAHEKKRMAIRLERRLKMMMMMMGGMEKVEGSVTKPLG